MSEGMSGLCTCEDSGPRKGEGGQLRGSRCTLAAGFTWPEYGASGGQGGRGNQGCRRNDHCPRGAPRSVARQGGQPRAHSQTRRFCRGLHESGWHAGLLRRASEPSCPGLFFFFFLRFSLFLERGEGREKERERNIDWLPLTHSPTRHLACNPGMCPDQESNQRPFSLRDAHNPLRHTSQG